MQASIQQTISTFPHDNSSPVWISQEETPSLVLSLTKLPLSGTLLLWAHSNSNLQITKQAASRRLSETFTKVISGFLARKQMECFNYLTDSGLTQWKTSFPLVKINGHDIGDFKLAYFESKSKSNAADGEQRKCGCCHKKSSKNPFEMI